jgi:hypothetical protein
MKEWISRKASIHGSGPQLAPITDNLQFRVPKGATPNQELEPHGTAGRPALPDPHPDPDPDPGRDRPHSPNPQNRRSHGPPRTPLPQACPLLCSHRATIEPTFSGPNTPSDSYTSQNCRTSHHIIPHGTPLPGPASAPSPSAPTRCRPRWKGVAYFPHLPPPPGRCRTPRHRRRQNPCR